MKKTFLVLLMLAFCVGSAFAAYNFKWPDPVSDLKGKINTLETEEKKYRIFFGIDAIPSGTYTSEYIKELTNTDPAEIPLVYNESETLTDIIVLAVVQPTTCSSMFKDCTSLIDVRFSSSFVTSNATSMTGMFYNCSSLTSLDLSKFDTSNVTSMSSMFYNCSSLTSLDLSKFDTSIVTSMGLMFYNCSSLTSLDLSKFDTSNVINTNSMFYNCSSLTSLDLSKFDTHYVMNMNSMFYNCSSLTSLDLSKFDTSNVRFTKNMFESCTNLEKIFLSDSFEITENCNTDSMFDAAGGSIFILNGSKFKEYVDQKDPSYGPRLIFVTHEGATNWYESTSAIIRDKITLLVNVGFENARVPLHSAVIEYPDYTTREGKKTESYGNGVGDLPVPELLEAPCKTGYVSFSQLEIDVAPSQMTQNIAFTYKYGEDGKESWSKTFTFAEVVKRYKQQMPDTTNLMDAVLLYGRYAQEHFNPDGTADLPTEATLSAEDISTANANLSTVKPAKYVFKGVENSYPTSIDKSSFGLEFIGNSLVCYSDMRVRHSFSYAEGISWDGYKVTCSDPNRALVLGKIDGERMYVDVGGFAPYQFSKEYTVTITNIATEDAFSITYCPRSYMAGAVSCADEKISPQSLKNLCMAAALLYVQANSYFTVPLY